MMQWKSSHLSKQTLGSPSQHGLVWDKKNCVYHPVMTQLSPLVNYHLLEAKMQMREERFCMF